MKLTLCSLLLTICFCSLTPAQDVQDAKTKKLLEQAAKNGNGLQTEITVNGSVHVQAVLIPRIDAKRIFGKEIGENYAVIEINVGNKSSTAALIIHGVFIDYRDWPLSGVPPSDMLGSGSTDKYQAPSVPSQVASEEYRVVRGQLLDAQTDTARNRFLRWLTLAGNLAGAFTFSLNEQGIVKGIAAATGVGIPGVATAWPDRTIEQLNRVSDLGFRTNKLVPKESSEVIVCFFPIDRFLSPGFRKLFLKSPALFFAPLQMLADKSVQSDAQAALDDIGGGFKVKDLAPHLPCFMVIQHQANSPAFGPCLDEFGLELDPTAGPGKVRVKRTDKGVVNPAEVAKFKPFMALDFIGNVSLNRVTVTVDGVMAVNVDSVAARVDEVEIDKVADCGDAGSECLWTNITAAGGARTGVIRGSYIKGAELKLAEADALAITDLKKVDEGSTDNEFHFSFKLNAPVRNQTKLHFTMTKPAASANGKPLESNTWEYTVAYPPSAAAITDVAVDNIATPTKLTVTGKGFAAKPLVVSLVPKAGGAVNKVTVKPTTSSLTDTSFEVLLPTDTRKLQPGCWYVQVQAGDPTSNKSESFAIPPDPSLTSAERTDKFIFVKGKDLIDFSGCSDRQVHFKLLKNDNTDSTDLKVINWSNGAPVLLELPEKAKTGEWKVQVFLKADKKGDDKPLTVRQ